MNKTKENQMQGIFKYALAKTTVEDQSPLDMIEDCELDNLDYPIIYSGIKRTGFCNHRSYSNMRLYHSNRTGLWVSYLCL